MTKDAAIVEIWKQPFIGKYNRLPPDAVLADKYKHLNNCGWDFIEFRERLARRVLGGL